MDDHALLRGGQEIISTEKELMSVSQKIVLYPETKVKCASSKEMFIFFFLKGYLGKKCLVYCKRYHSFQHRKSKK
jgi:hypothetical protein